MEEKLTEEQKIILLNKLKNVIKNSCGNTKQIKVPKKGNPEKILAYIVQYEFCEQTEIKLIERGISEEILAYIAKYHLCGIAIIKLIERGNKKEVNLFLKIYHPEITYN